MISRVLLQRELIYGMLKHNPDKAYHYLAEE